MASTSPAEARAHIQQIGWNWLQCDDRIADFVTNVLELLSCELCDTSTHFVQELLQNADDNDYDCETPTLRFTYKPGSLRVDCNERGFNPSNVEAICTIRKSTKVGQRGSTGEKGIGFKSVFRAADIVWISSGVYSFRFDRNRRFGLVAPLWADFPEPVLEGYTSFYFELSPQFDETELVQTLLQFDAAQILFLRRLRHVELELLLPDGQVCTKHIHRTDACEDGNAVSYLETGDTRSKYLVYKHRIINLPTEAKRPGCTDSDLLLAFPFLDREKEPPPGLQMVYAGLPIGNTDGLKFLLHGDFLLTASRLQIDISLPWNQVLRDGLTEALLRAITVLNETSMRYCWPFFINPNDTISAFFEPALTATAEQLQTECLLESLAGTNARPSDLWYVHPRRFADQDGVPLTLWAAGSYLSTNYPPWTIDSIEALGVDWLCEATFLSHLTTKTGSGGAFSRQPPKWHSVLAKALLSLMHSPKHKQSVRDLQIIPLSDGTWTSASHEPTPMLMSDKCELAGLSIDDSIPIVNPEAAADEARRSLFRALDIMSIDSTRLCEWICDQHGSPSFKPQDWTTSQLVGHARLLYDTGWAPAGSSVDLWFATEAGYRCLGSELYMRPTAGDGRSHAFHRVFNVLMETSDCIHSDYFSPGLCSESENGSNDTPCWDPPQAHFTTYLTTTLGVAQLPRLVTIDLSHNRFGLSADFEFLLNECRIEDVLHVLLENWPSYCKWIELSSDTDKGEPAQDREHLVAWISRYMVKTSQGRLHLRDTVVPGLDPFIEDTMLPVLDLGIGSAESEKEQGIKTMRQRLGLFKVITENTLRFYFACLDHLRKQSSPDTETVAYVYEQIQSRYEENEELVERHFKQGSLIYVESKSAKSDANGRRWADIKTCRSSNIDLEAEYPRSNHLFQSLLATGGLTLSELVQNAAQITPATNAQKILQTLTDINKVLPLISTKRAALALKLIRSKAIFPVDRAKETMSRLMAPDREDWFIADRVHLRGAFLGVVNLLAFAPKELEAIQALINAFGLNSRKLSIVVESENRPSGRLRYDDPYTRTFARRAHFIQAVIPLYRRSYCQVYEKIERVQVSTAAKVTLAHTLTFGGRQIIGRPDSSLVACSAAGEILQVFITEECDPSRLPVPDIVQMLSEHFEIKDPTHLGLLFTLFDEKSHGKIQKAFERQGFELPPISDDAQLPSMKHYYSSAVSIPCPFNYETHSDDSDGLGWHFGTHHKLSIARNGRSRLRTWSINDTDRRLPILGLAGDYAALGGKDQAGSLVWSVRDLCERMISDHFERHLGQAYDALKHWTGPLRSQNPPGGHQDTSPFTLGGPDLSDQVTTFLMNNGISNIQHLYFWKPTFHFELVISAGGPFDSFKWTGTQLTRARTHRLPSNPSVQVYDVMVLIRIFNIYTQPQFRFFVDPWELVSSGRVRFHDLDEMPATTIQEADLGTGTPALPIHTTAGASHQWATQISAPSNYSHAQAAWGPQYFYQSGFSHYGPYMNTTMQPYSIPTYVSTAEGDFARPSLVSRPVLAIPWEDKGIYSYKDLKRDEIRLLALFPGQREDVLRGAIYSTPFEQAGSYAAVSYVWGYQRAAHNLITPDGILRIHASLFRALVRLRKPTEVTVLWADGICINQKDNDEKSRQVRLLPRIFQDASVTVAMLGYESQMGSAVEALKALRDAHLKDPESAELLPGDAKDWESRWALITRLFDSDWFRRVWIVQEAVASPEVVFFCGDSTIDWSDLFAVMRNLDQHHQLPAAVDTAWAPFSTLSQLRIWEARKTRWSVLLLLETFRNVKSSLTRDRFFALLGISSDGDLPGFAPDYQSSLEVVVCSFARALVARGMGMQLLLRAGLGSQPHRFPSWIPDWTVPKPPSLSNSRDRGVVFNACGNTEAQITCPEADSSSAASWTELAVEGYIIANIKCVSKACNEPEAWSRYFAEVDAMVDQLSPLFSTRMRQELKLQVPIAGAKHPQVALPDSLDLGQSYKAFRKILKKQNYTKKYQQQRNSPPSSDLVSDGGPREMSLVAKSKSYGSLLGGSIKGWRFAIAGRHCGIVPNIVRGGATR